MGKWGGAKRYTNFVNKEGGCSRDEGNTAEIAYMSRRGEEGGLASLMGTA